jgi:hypothetical protein
VVIGGGIILVNNKKLMGVFRGGPILNAGLAAALIFSLMISWAGIQGLAGLIK